MLLETEITLREIDAMTSALRDIHLLPPQAKAAAYFEAARAAAHVEQHDHAIALFLAGLRYDPQGLAAHADLRDASLRRKAAGGRALGLLDRLRMRVVRDSHRRMLDAARILAHDPGDTDAMADMSEAARDAGYDQVVAWLTTILERARRDAPQR